MMFSTRSEYGVRVMIQLGRRHGAGPVSLAGVAEAERLPLAYLEQLVARLRKAELVASTRGAHGGYELARAPERDHDGRGRRGARGHARADAVPPIRDEPRPLQP